jgi:signal transduction histidine kinase
VALSVLILGTTLIILTSFLYEGVKRTQQEAFDTALYNHAVDIAGATDLGLLGGLVVKRDVLIDENKIFPFVLGQSLVQYRTMDGGVVLSSQHLGSSRLPLTETVVEQVIGNGTVLATFELPRDLQARGRVPIEPGPYRVVNYLVRKEQLPPLILQVAAPLTSLFREQEQTLSLFLTLIPLALLAAAFTALLISNRALSAVNRIVKSAQAIGPQELSARVPVPQETELGVLALTLNEMLARLQHTFESQDQFIADASHQLKTPLAIIRGEIEVFQKAPRSPDETSALHTSVLQEVRQLSKTVDDLLMLARFDSLQPMEFKAVRIDEVIFETIALLSRPAKEKGVEIQFNIETPPGDPINLEVRGDADLLRVMFFNLIENSIKYARKSGVISVRISRAPLDDLSQASGAHSLKIEIEDQGVGIAEEDLPKIFLRFYRSANAGQRAQGVGLGLSIAQRIAILHDAELSVRSQIGVGTVFSIRIKNS